MKRRSFLALLGLSPLVTVKPSLVEAPPAQKPPWPRYVNVTQSRILAYDELPLRPINQQTYVLVKGYDHARSMVSTYPGLAAWLEAEGISA